MIHHFRRPTPPAAEPLGNRRARIIDALWAQAREDEPHLTRPMIEAGYNARALADLATRKATTRKQCIGGHLGPADLAGLYRRVARDHDMTPEELQQLDEAPHV